MWFSVGAWFLTLNSVVASIVDLNNATEHTLKKCFQDGMLNIQCEVFEQDDTEKFSYWPPGPYVLPMTRYGCPESQMHGWREGFIRLAWKEPHQIQIVSNSSTIKMFDNDSVAYWPPKNYKLLIPATPNSVTLYFCYKHRSNSVVDTGSWPDENYSLYKTEKDCPPEFENHSTIITVPDLSWWLSDGYLPDFSVSTNNTVGTLELKLCTHRKSSNRSFTDDNKFSNQTNSATDNSSLDPYRNWTHYILIKNKNTSCPNFASTVMLEEFVYIGQFQNKSLAMMEMIETLCFYEKTTDDDWLYERRRKNAYSVTITSLGAKRKCTRLREISLFGKVCYFGYAYINRWTIVDLGRTIPVSAVEITTVKFAEYAVMAGIHQPLGPCINHDFTCFISSGKYTFLHSEAMSCLYTEYCRVDCDTTLFEIEQQGDSFKIIQSAFGRNPEKFKGRALASLKKLKEKWKCVENDLEVSLLGDKDGMFRFCLLHGLLGAAAVFVLRWIFLNILTMIAGNNYVLTTFISECCNLLLKYLINYQT